MDIRMWLRGATTAGLGLALAGTATAQVRPPAPAPAPAPAQRTNQAAPAPGADNPNPRAAGDVAKLGDRRGGDLPGPIDSPKDIQDTLKLAFMAADEDHNGLISRQEAVDAGNLLVGGLFFRADANGDGKLTQDEARQSRQKMLRQNPVLRLFLQEARKEQGAKDTDRPGPLRNLAALLDENNDKQLEAKEVRDAVQTTVEGLYEVADTDRDNQMSPAEVNAAALGLARTAAQAAFRMADKDNSGGIGREEFEQAILEPARVAFGVLDGNDDGQVSPEEARQAERFVLQQMRVAVPDARGSQAPIPDFGAAAPARGDRGGNAPAPAPRTPR